MPNDEKHLDLQQLRKKAEQIVDERKEEKSEKSESDISDMVRLIHELEVYQEEVELQNQELRHSAKNLENARNEWFELFDAAPVGFVIMNRLGMIERCNQAAARLLTGTRHPMSGRSMLPRIHPDDQEIYHSLVRSMTENPGVASSRELRLVQENKRTVFVHMEGSVVKDAEGKFNQFRVALVDISD